jgi:hypothetical protein
MLSRVGFEMRRIRQPVSPFEPVLAHYPDDTPALRREPFFPSRSRGNSRHIDGESGFVQGLSWR